MMLLRQSRGVCWKVVIGVREQKMRKVFVKGRNAQEESKSPPPRYRACLLACYTILFVCRHVTYKHSVRSPMSLRIVCTCGQGAAWHLIATWLAELELFHPPIVQWVCCHAKR